MGASCFFIGHHDAPSSLYNALEHNIEFLISNYNVDQFYIGQYGAFDCMALRAAITLKQKYPHIQIFIALAYLRNKEQLPEGADGYLFPSGQESVPPSAAIPRLNRELLKMSDYVISYVVHISSGAYRTLQKARLYQKRSSLQILNLAEESCGFFSP